jgi:hypothetical protein
MDLATARRMTRKRQRATRTRDRDAFALGGGLNLVDPPLTIKPGYALAGLNYEIGVNGGYECLAGHEAFDGRDSPSEETYHVLAFRHSAAFTVDLAEGEIVTGAAAGEGTIIEVVEVSPWGSCRCAYSEDLNNALWTYDTAAADLADIDPPEVDPYAVDLNGRSDSAAEYDTRDWAPRTVWRLREDSSASSVHTARVHWLGGGTGLIGDQLSVSVYAKRDERRYIQLRPLSGSAVLFVGSVLPIAVFDLEEGEVVSTTATVESAHIEALGNGWYRCFMETGPLISSSANLTAVIGLVDDTLNNSYAGDGVSGVYVTGLNTDLRAGAAPQRSAYARSRQAADLPIPTGIAYVALRDVTAFTAGSDTQDQLEDSSGVIVGVWSGGEQERAAPTVAKHQEYLDYVAAVQRALITPVPGSGPMRGVWFYKGTVYAFRDNDGATAGRMYRSTSTGWDEVTFDTHLNFDAGLAAGEEGLVQGATLTGATSGASAPILRVNVIDDAWGTSAAVGTLVLGAVTSGPFQNNEVIRVGGVAMATADGAVYTPTFAAGGRYRFRTHNFYGASNRKRMYGVYGGGRYFEYDDTDGCLASYRTGMPTDTPEWLAIDANQLMLGFPGGSWQVGGVGTPANWTVTLGAAEIGLGDDITGVIEELAGSLFLFTRGRTFQLSGDPFNGYSLDTFDFENGAIADSVQKIGFGIHLDDRGFGSLTSSDRHGNYQANTFSRLIQPLVSRLLKTATVTESVIHRAGNRYRCFFDDGTFISIGVSGNKVTGHMLCSFAGKVVRCAVSEEDTDGTERIFFGSDDGYIYEAEKGTSFNGDHIHATLRPAFHHSGHPDRIKHYRTGRVEAVVDGPCSLSVTTDLSFGETVQAERDISALVGGAIWNLADFETFNYNARIEPLKTFRIEADGTHIGLVVRHVSRTERPHTLRAIVFQSSLRGLRRRASA